MANRLSPKNGNATWDGEICGGRSGGRGSEVVSLCPSCARLLSVADRDDTRDGYNYGGESTDEDPDVYLGRQEVLAQVKVNPRVCVWAM